MFHQRVGVGAALTALLIMGASAVSAAPAPTAAHAPVRIIVKLKPTLSDRVVAALPADLVADAGIADPDVASFLGRHGVTAARPLYPALLAALRAEGVTERTLAARTRDRFRARSARRPGRTAAPALARTFILELPSSTNAHRAAELIAADPQVQYAEVDAVATATALTDDPYLSSSGSWGQAYDDLWGIKKVGAPAAWDTTTGSGTIVAVIDTGVDYNHREIAPRMWANPGEKPGNGVDDDLNGFVDDIRGWDFIGRSDSSPRPDNHPTDENGHGTHVAGTIAAVGNNAAGVVGVAWGAQVMNVRALGANGRGLASGLANAIMYATNNGADVINASWSVKGPSQTIADAIAAAHAAGVVIVASAGNDHADARGYVPARLPQVITVTAMTPDDQPAAFSNWGTRVDLAAPGVGILSLRRSGPCCTAYGGTPVAKSYGRADGTSTAAAHVSGIAALVLASHPTWTNEDVRQALRSTAVDGASPGWDSEYGFGVADAAAAVNATSVLRVQIQSPVDGARVASPISVTGLAKGPGFVSYTLEYGSGGSPYTGPASWTLIQQGTSLVDGGTLGAFDPTRLADGVYTLRLSAVDGGGTVFVDRLQVTVDHVTITAPAAPGVPTTSANDADGHRGNGSSISPAAQYDAALGAPACLATGSMCDSGTLLLGRSTLGPEPSHPNVIGATCSDGTTGSFHVDESNDRIRVFTADGSPIRVGATVTVEATVWAYNSFAEDGLDLYRTSDANAPSWFLIATLSPTVAGQQTLSSSFVVPPGGLQAVRAQFRYGAGSGPCTSGAYNDRDDLVFAVAASSEPALTVSAVGVSGSADIPGNGSVGVSIPAGGTCDTSVPSCTWNHTPGAVVELTASAGIDGVFTGWNGDCFGTGPCSVTMSAARNVTATFQGPQRLTVSALATSASGEMLGNGVVQLNLPSGPASCDTSMPGCSYILIEGANVSLSATPGFDSVFVGWGGDCSGTGPCSVTLDGLRNVTATFQGPQRLTVSALATSASAEMLGNGVVQVNLPSGPASCDTSMPGCSYILIEGANVSLSATPGIDSVFVGWGGDCSGTGPCSVTLDGLRNVTATFQGPQRLTIGVIGSAAAGSSVEAQPGGVCTGPSCSFDYTHGNVVTLLPTPAPSAVFAGWAGDCSGVGACSVTLSAARSVDATFVPAPTMAIGDATMTEKNTPAEATFTVTLSAASAATATVDWSTVANTARSGIDYTASSGTLTFAPGQTSRTFSVTVAGDIVDEPTEYFYVNLTGVVNAVIVDGQGRGRILDDDAPPAAYFTLDQVATEGDTSNTTSTFTVRLTAASERVVDVSYATAASGTATSGTDYTATSGVLRFNPGVTTRTFKVTVRGDTVDEARETYFVNLTSAMNASLGDSEAMGTIIDNDATPAGSPSLVIKDAPAVVEGDTGTVNATLTVLLSAPATTAVDFTYATSPSGTATSGVDYVAIVLQSATIAVGQSSTTITVAVIGDDIDEATSETFPVNITSASNATIADMQGKATITDDEP